MKQQKKSTDVKRKIMNILSGSVLTEDFFVKNTLFIGVLIIIMALYISNRYTYLEQMSKIESLQNELKDAKYENQSISTQLTGVSRQSKVEERIEKDELGLEVSNSPVYEVNQKDSLDDNKNK